MTDLEGGACPACGKLFKRAAKASEHFAAIPALCDRTTRFWARRHGVERPKFQLQEVKARPEPDPNNPWSYWQLQLAGEDPSVLLGPHWGFFSLREWIAPTPPERKKQPVDRPVAIWQDEGNWHCLITRDRTSHLTEVMDVHEVFSRCCRDPLTHESYLVKVKEIEDGRAGSDRLEIQSAD